MFQQSVGNFRLNPKKVMIGTSKELLLYTVLVPKWYKPIGLTERKAYKIKRLILDGRLSEETESKILLGLDFIKIRPSYVLHATFSRENEIFSERMMVKIVTSKRLWYKGVWCADFAADIKKGRYAELSVNTVDKIAEIGGFTKVSPRIFCPAVWEKPTNISDRAYTKIDALSPMFYDETEI